MRTARCGFTVNMLTVVTFVLLGLVPAVASAQTTDAVGVYRNGTWYLDKNGNGLWDGAAPDGYIGNWGGYPEDKIVLGDWNGSGTKKIGIYRNGTWYLDKNGNGVWDGAPTDGYIVNWGGYPEDIPVVGDWNNSGTTKIGIYRNGTWYLDKNGNGVWDGAPTDGYIVNWGGYPEDIPVVGDWDNSGTTKIGVYRNAFWYLDKNGDGIWNGPPTDGYIVWGGLPEDKIVVGDWNGSGSTKIGIYRNGTWFLDTNGNGGWDNCPALGGGADACIRWGGYPEDVPVVGDWNNSGTTKIGVYRNGTWYLDKNGNGLWDAATDGYIVNWGGYPGDTPMVGTW